MQPLFAFNNLCCCAGYSFCIGTHTFMPLIQTVMGWSRPISFLAVVSLTLFWTGTLNAQTDSTAAAKDSFFLLRQKGLLGKLARNIVVDTTAEEETSLQRNDRKFQRNRGRVIRRIIIRRLDFGTPINDTAKSFKNRLTNLADAFHRKTREPVIERNLFFAENERVKPYLLADNERHLRDLPYLGDARITLRRVPGTTDSVDVYVFTKDVLSIGGRFRMSSLKKFETALKEDNFLGSGDRAQISSYYDYDRQRRFGYGAEYIKRNLKGSFADLSVGFQDFYPAFNSFRREEKIVYARLVKPLVNTYTKWLYAFEGAVHETRNMYLSDSLYEADFKYNYYNVDAWVGYNMSSHNSKGEYDEDRLRTVLGLRFLHQHFRDVPTKYDTEYFYQYANITGVLASMSIFRQDFYKTQYVYGFGRNEDVPEGVSATVTGGWTNKQQRVRPYMGLDLQLNYFAKNDDYFNYTFRVGGYSYKRRYEDIDILMNLDFFSRMKNLGRKWRQRTFLSAGITTQINKELNEPLLLESPYGLQEFEDIRLGGDHRITVKAESVFFNNWRVLSFRFAPFVFGNASLLTPIAASLNQSKYYSTVGAGVRTRNESLIFGTLEFRAYYFPTRNFNNERFRFDFSTNVRFKYNSELVKRPEFIQVN
jgi:hypothetical protein